MTEFGEVIGYDPQSGVAVIRIPSGGLRCWPWAPHRKPSSY